MIVVPSVVVSRIAPVKECVFRTPLEDQPDEEAYVRLPGRRFIEGGGKTAGSLVNHRDFRLRSKSLI
jgi:hypothetical protein